MKTAWFTKSRLIVLFVLIILLIAVTLFFVLRGDKSEENTFDQALTSAGQLTESGDYDQALAALKQAQNDTQGIEQQLRMLSNLAAAAANAGQLVEALGYYAQKHQLDPSSTSADGLLVGELYERLAENQKAIENFEAYLNYITANPTEENAQARIDSVVARIEQLKEVR